MKKGISALEISPIFSSRTERVTCTAEKMFLDCKNESCRRVAEGAPRTVDNLCDDCRAHMDKLEKCLKSSGTEYRIDPHIVRGLDYYTRTVFEFIAEDIGDFFQVACAFPSRGVPS